MATVTIEELLQILVAQGGSDLHISAGSPPKVRVDGHLYDTEHDPMRPEATKTLIYSFLTSDQIARFEKDYELDLSFGLEGLGRFRVNVFYQRGSVGSVLRMIPEQVRPFDQLGLPRVICEQISALPRGLVLVTGATGSGKSTTLAAMLDFVNDTRADHVLTIEDPIEFLHRNKGCLFNQREVGSDTKGFKHALKSALREDPDVVLVGEMRDTETIEAALTIAETGHLTFGTLHTSDAVQSINRVIDVFPAHQQQQIRTQLSFTLQAVFCQQLIPAASGSGRVLALEVMMANSAVRALIRDDKAHQIYSIIQTGGKLGMQTMNQALGQLVRDRHITFEQALQHSGDIEDLKRTLQMA
ncbi:MAG: type IV pilus twitching motility protein PilT [Planctomycetes bacterium]|nr:type IV pilus twitching motility protein PilT [Planctomycetota bacterium]MCB9826277.1 type IV pilus twitching motility protein PilT [Planctomycetota bacterium]